MSIEILYEDSWLVAINKPANILSVPAKNPNKANCYQHILKRCPSARVVHRLDEPTSGILLFALDTETEKKLHQQFRQQQIKKEYLAVVQGILKPTEGRINVPLKSDWPNRPKQKICWQTGKRSLTKWIVIRHDKTSTRLKLIPHSGRTHQLRLHMQYIGHPIIGDLLYNPQSSIHQHQRLLLHAKRLTFYHPISMVTLHIETTSPF